MLYDRTVVSDIAIFVLKRDVKHQLSNYWYDRTDQETTLLQSHTGHICWQHIEAFIEPETKTDAFAQNSLLKLIDSKNSGTEQHRFLLNNTSVFLPMPWHLLII